MKARKMKGEDKTKEQLINELAELRQRIAEQALVRKVRQGLDAPQQGQQCAPQEPVRSILWEKVEKKDRSLLA